MRLSSFVVAGLLLVPRVSSAQPPPPTTDPVTMSIVRHLSLRMDTLQVRSDLLTPGGDAANSGASSVDVAKRSTSDDDDLPYYQIAVGGWAFICSPGLAVSVTDMGRTYSDVVVDDVELPNTLTRVARADVVDAYFWYCANYGGSVPLESGANVMVDARPFGRGPEQNGWHTVKFRTYDLYGRMRDSLARSVFIPPGASSASVAGAAGRNAELGRRRDR